MTIIIRKKLGGPQRKLGGLRREMKGSQRDVAMLPDKGIALEYLEWNDP